jgi:hypothetical protein
MGEVIDLAHARASQVGRSTSPGQSVSTGQLSENQRITSSYLRAVKVLSASSKRSKKRQSPAAKRPIVAMLTALADPYAEAHAMRFDRSSVSITADNSRKIPTPQANSVGKFRLVENSDMSDKSAMSSLQEVRNRIQQAIDAKGDSSITLALDWDLERNHIRDFLEEKKDSLKPEVLLLLSEKYAIPFNLLIIKRKKKQRKVAA